MINNSSPESHRKVTEFTIDGFGICGSHKNGKHENVCIGAISSVLPYFNYII